MVEGYRDEKTGKVRHRNLLSLSKLPAKQLLAIEASLKEDTTVEKVKLENLELISSKDYGNIAIFSKLFDQAFGEIIDNKYKKEIKAIVINKIFEPRSKNSLENWIRQTDLNYEITNRNKLYESLDELEENQTKIEKYLSKKQKKPELLLYDITSTYFEGKGAQELCKYGYSRDHREDRLQVNIGLVTSEDGTPLRVEVIAGNITDKQTVRNKIDDLKKEFDIEEVTFIFDRGMKTKINIEYLRENNFDYISCLSHRELKKQAENNKEIQLTLFDKKNLVEFIIEEEGRKKKLVLCYNPEKAKKDKITRNQLIEQTEKKLKNIQDFKREYKKEEIEKKVIKVINKYNCEKFLNYEIKEGKLIYNRQEEKIKEYEQYDGFYMLESSRLNIDEEGIQKRYKSLAIVESAFKDVKNIIEIRPVFHYKNTRIKGHIFSCFMSYYLLNMFSNKVTELLEKHSLDKLLSELKMIRKSYFKIGNYCFSKITKLNELQKKLFQIFRLPFCCAESTAQN